MEADVWEKETNKVRKNEDKFIEIAEMGHSDEYRVMAQFVDSLRNNSTKIKLLIARERKSHSQISRSSSTIQVNTGKSGSPSEGKKA